VKLFAKERRTFPNPDAALTEGIVDLSDDLRVERLLEAYSFGIFPWPHEELPTLWYSPEERGILEFADLHVPRSLRKFIEKSSWKVSFNRDFRAVIEACAVAPRPGQNGTWITGKLLQAYVDFHRAGYAQSVEVWDGRRLVGGMYGVYVGGLFSGESMFFHEDNASKVALLHLIEFLGRQGLTWMDIQMVTPALQAFGGKYIPRREFLRRLELAKASARGITFAADEPS
jgi:leucyl/phenylalanyl-tRNA--protein transferase